MGNTELIEIHVNLKIPKTCYDTFLFQFEAFTQSTHTYKGISVLKKKAVNTFNDNKANNSFTSMKPTMIIDTNIEIIEFENPSHFY